MSVLGYQEYTFRDISRVFLILFSEPYMKSLLYYNFNEVSKYYTSFISLNISMLQARYLV